MTVEGAAAIPALMPSVCGVSVYVVLLYPLNEPLYVVTGLVEVAVNVNVPIEPDKLNEGTL